MNLLAARERAQQREKVGVNATGSLHYICAVIFLQLTSSIIFIHHNRRHRHSADILVKFIFLPIQMNNDPRHESLAQAPLFFFAVKNIMRFPI